MVDHPDDARMLGSEFVGNLTGTIGRSVIDNNDLELRGIAGQELKALLCYSTDGRFVIVDWEKRLTVRSDTALER
jgi:hypothetical protein